MSGRRINYGQDHKLPILGISGRSRVGKDTAAAAICESIQGAERVAFASHLKAVSAQLFGFYGLKGEDYYEEHPDKRTEPLQTVGKTPVELWVEIGCKMREVYPDLWVDRALNATRLDPVRLVVVSDVRFPNEAEAIRRRGGWVVRIGRPHGGQTHGSDDEFPDGFKWDARIVNDGSVDDLKRVAVRLASNYLEQREKRPVVTITSRADALFDRLTRLEERVGELRQLLHRAVLGGGAA